MSFNKRKYFLNLIFFSYPFRPDVYYVTVNQALAWMSDPKPLKQVNNIELWDCTRNLFRSASKPCEISIKCALSHKPMDSNITDTRYMETCRDCPNKYPWLGDAEGTGISGRDNYIFNGASSNSNVNDENAGDGAADESASK